MSNILFSGEIDVIVPEQIGLTRAQRRMIRDSFDDGTGLPQHQRFACAIAEAVGAAISEGVEVDGKLYMPNPKVRPQFGKNRKGLPYLTFGLIDPDTNKSWTLTWEGADNIPVEMAKVAVKHDRGERAKTQRIPLSLDNAVVHETGNKQGKGRPNDQRRNHDTAKDGNPYPRKPRPNHNRLCAEDVKKIMRQMASAR